MVGRLSTFWNHHYLVQVHFPSSFKVASFDTCIALSPLHAGNFIWITFNLVLLGFYAMISLKYGSAEKWAILLDLPDLVIVRIWPT